MSKRQKKNRKKIVLSYYLDNPKDVALLEIVERAYEHSAFEDMGITISGFAKWLIGESLLQMELQIRKQQAEEAAREQEVTTKQQQEEAGDSSE